MTNLHKLYGVAACGLALLAAAPLSFGQASDETEGVIGKRYVSANAFLDDIRDYSDNGYGGTVGVNYPVYQGIDLGGGLGYETVKGDGFDIKQNSIQGGATFYNRESGYTPFFSAGLGYAWDKIDVSVPAPGFNDRDENAFYALSAGVEFPFAPATVGLVELAYVDGFDSDIDSSWQLSLGVNHWFTKRFALHGNVNIVEDDAVVLSVGVRFAF
jgi:hypothetical protein